MVRYSKWVACIGLLVSGSVMAFTKPPFPRLSVVANGGAQNYGDPSIEQRFAKFNFSMLAIYPGWTDPAHITYEQMVRNIKALNSSTMIFPYINVMAEVPSPNAGAMAEVAAKLDAQRWWVYASGTSGAAVPSPGAPAWRPTNITNAVAPDANGDRWNTWYAKWVVRNFYQMAPSIDGFWADGVEQKPQVDGDWNLDGVIDNIFSAAPAYKQGYVTFYNTLRTQMPGKYQLGNLADWGRPDIDLSTYNGMLNGGMIEDLIGRSYSVETYGGWQAMMDWYRKIMAAVADPKLVQFHLAGRQGDYQSMRYALTSCLMDDGYFTFTFQDTAATTPDTAAPWFDEYNANLGYATATPPTADWQSGVYRRDFQNGIALVNPKGNGARQVFLEADYVKISGSQVPNINNGQTVRSVILQDRDGIVLMRVGAQQGGGSGTTSGSSSSSQSVTTVAASSSSSASSSASVASGSTPLATPAAAKVPAPPPVITVQ